MNSKIEYKIEFRRDNIVVYWLVWEINVNLANRKLHFNLHRTHNAHNNIIHRIFTTYYNIYVMITGKR